MESLYQQHVLNYWGTVFTALGFRVATFAPEKNVQARSAQKLKDPPLHLTHDFLSALAIAMAIP